MKDWTEKHIRGLLHEGKIQGFKAHPRVKNYSEGKAVVIPKPKSKAICWLDLNLQYWCNTRALTLHCAANGGELQFDPERKFRFDYAIPAILCAVEFEGGVFLKTSGHNTAKHYTKDTDKYNRAAVLGWTVIRVTALNYTTVLKTLNELVK